jgi:hypothetical protein
MVVSQQCRLALLELLHDVLQMKKTKSAMTMHFRTAWKCPEMRHGRYVRSCIHGDQQWLRPRFPDRFDKRMDNVL